MPSRPLLERAARPTAAALETILADALAHASAAREPPVKAEKADKAEAGWMLLVAAAAAVAARPTRRTLL